MQESNFHFGKDRGPDIDRPNDAFEGYTPSFMVRRAPVCKLAYIVECEMNILSFPAGVGLLPTYFLRCQDWIARTAFASGLKFAGDTGK